MMEMGKTDLNGL